MEEWNIAKPCEDLAKTVSSRDKINKTQSKARDFFFPFSVSSSKA